MNKGTIFAIGAVVTGAVGYAGYKYFTSTKAAADPVPAITKEESPETALIETVEVDVTLVQVEVAPADAVEDVTPDAEASLEEIVVDETTQETYRVTYNDAVAKFRESVDGVAKGTVDEVVMFKSSFDMYAIRMVDPEVMAKLGETAKLIVRDNNTMLTFNIVGDTSEIKGYRIDADRERIRGVEVRHRDGKRRYQRDSETILDALLNLSQLFEHQVKVHQSAAIEHEALIEA